MTDRIVNDSKLEKDLDSTLPSKPLDLSPQQDSSHYQDFLSLALTIRAGSIANGHYNPCQGSSRLSQLYTN